MDLETTPKASVKRLGPDLQPVERALVEERAAS
jgi:hypothetical protein